MLVRQDNEPRGPSRYVAQYVRHNTSQIRTSFLHGAQLA